MRALIISTLILLVAVPAFGSALRINTGVAVVGQVEAPLDQVGSNVLNAQLGASVAFDLGNTRGRVLVDLNTVTGEGTPMNAYVSYVLKDILYVGPGITATFTDRALVGAGLQVGLLNRTNDDMLRPIFENVGMRVVWMADGTLAVYGLAGVTLGL